ncbi:hypothetical protein M9H77_01807 [Catharanthus roseus]|uniref:Uncharacterized protein n=1 Tax=Catharanthus roseus TaxID=4058 RepID=A0ACC0C6Q8_CATRO|nr:hypothetical protein M9H77_01807 [Catharanthus roseus]
MLPLKGAMLKWASQNKANRVKIPNFKTKLQTRSRTQILVRLAARDTPTSRGKSLSSSSVHVRRPSPPGDHYEVNLDHSSPLFHTSVERYTMLLWEFCISVYLPFQKLLCWKVVTLTGLNEIGNVDQDNNLTRMLVSISETGTIDQALFGLREQHGSICILQFALHDFFVLSQNVKLLYYYARQKQEISVVAHLQLQNVPIMPNHLIPSLMRSESDKRKKAVGDHRILTLWTKDGELNDKKGSLNLIRYVYLAGIW